MVHVLGMMEELEKRDAKVLGVTSQDAEELEKYLTFHETPGKIVNDTGKEVMKLYGLEDDVGPPRGVIYNPADIILDREGIMRFVYIWEDSSDYPDDQKMLDLLDVI